METFLGPDTCTRYLPVLFFFFFLNLVYFCLFICITLWFTRAPVSPTFPSHHGHLSCGLLTLTHFPAFAHTAAAYRGQEITACLELKAVCSLSLHITCKVTCVLHTDVSLNSYSLNDFNSLCVFMCVHCCVGPPKQLPTYRSLNAISLCSRSIISWSKVWTLN